MTGEEDNRAPASQEAGRNGYRVLLVFGVVFLFFGLLTTAGSLMSNKLLGGKLGDPFDFIFDPLLLYLFPSLLIAYSLAKMKSRFRITAIGLIGITVFGMGICFMGEITKTHNYFVRADEDSIQTFNNIEILYQKRFNLIKNLDSTSKNYQLHEKSIIKEIAESRKMVMTAPSENEKIPALRQFDYSVQNLVVNVEQYPNLKSDQIVLALIKEMIATEQELLVRKEKFNAQVTDYNRSIRIMPYAIAARMFNFKAKRFIDNEASFEIYNAAKSLSTP